MQGEAETQRNARISLVEVMTRVTQGWIFTFASNSDVLRMVEGGPVSDDCHNNVRTGHFTPRSLTWESLGHAKSLCHLSDSERNYEG